MTRPLQTFVLCIAFDPDSEETQIRGEARHYLRQTREGSFCRVASKLDASIFTSEEAKKHLLTPTLVFAGAWMEEAE